MPTDAAARRRRSTATRRARLTNNLGNVVGARRRLNRLHVRIAVSEAAAWTGAALLRRPLPRHPQRRRTCPSRARRARADDGRRCGSPSSARPSSARACRCCCAPSRRCASTCRRELTLVGATHEEVAPLLLDARGVRALGKVDDERKRARAARSRRAVRAVARRRELRHGAHRGVRRGTPVVASDIAGYRDVVRDGVDGVLVPRGDADRARRGAARPRARPRPPRARSARAAARARRSATPGRASPTEVLGAYEDAIARARARDRAPRASPSRSACARPTASRARARGGCRASSPRRAGAAAAAASPCARARRAASSRAAGARRAARSSRSQRIGVDAIGAVAARLEPGVGARRPRRDVRLDGPARARLARDPARRAAAARACGAATRCRARSIGVLMSATLPARLGEPSRALVVARRLGRAREHLPVGARHDRLADAAERPRARDPRRRDVLDRRPLHATTRRCSSRSRSRRSRSSLSRAGRARAAARRLPRARARAALVAQARAALVQLRQGLRVFRRPRLGAAGGGRPARRPGRCSGSLLRAARRARPRRQRRASAPPRPCSSRSTSPRSCRPRRRTSASSRPRASRCSAPTASARPTRWPTGSSCRRSRSRPPWSWARPRS